MDPYHQQQAQDTPDLLSYLQLHCHTQSDMTASEFVEKAKAFLEQNRPVENFPADQNHGVRLSNNDRVLICPPVPAPGTTVDAGAVEITHGASQKGQEGVDSTDSQRIV